MTERREDGNQVARRAPSLPSTVDELLSQRRSERVITLNDYVDGIHVALWEQPPYRRALDAVYDEDAVEGSLAADNFIAAQMIREYARSHNVPQVAEKKIATIVKALNVVLRRFNMSRQQRARMIGGVIVGDHGMSAAAE